MLIRSRAPVRIDFAGGWTDVALFARDTPGKVVNATINIYSFATIRTSEGAPSEAKLEESIQDKSIQIYSSDYDVYIEADDIRKLEYDGNIDLVKAAIKRLKVEGGFTMNTQSNAPPGSGLGTSASMGVALIGALANASDQYFLQYQVAELASAIEREELGILGGKQDHYASAMGGVGFMEFHGDEVRSSRLVLSPDTLLELEKNLVVCYTGKSRLSGDIHAKVTGAFKSGEANTVGAISDMKRIAESMKNALMAGDLAEFAELMNENWRCQKRLHPSVTNDTIEGLFELAFENGAIGGKASGAGGGGCLIFYCRPESEYLVRRRLEEAGVKVLVHNLEAEGLRTWRVQE